MNARIILSIGALFSSAVLSAQCAVTAASDTVTACVGDTVWLSASGAQSYLWTNDTTVACDTCSQTFALVSSDPHYILLEGTASTVQPATNGNFSSGNTGFLSNYNYNAFSIWNEGTYAVGPNPNTVHPNFSAWGDHTTGTGNYMLVNGSTTANKVLWRQTVNFPAGAQVTMRWWMLTFATPAGSLQLKLYGSNVGTAVTTPTGTGTWSQYSKTFTMPATGTGIINLVTLSSAGSGNDFGVDDITFEYNCQSYDTVWVMPLSQSLLSVQTDTAGFYCDSTCFSLYNSLDTSSLLSYQWYLQYPNGSSEVRTDTAFEWCVQDTGVYDAYVIALSNDGCVDSAYIPPFKIGATRTIDSLAVSSEEGFWSNGTYVMHPSFTELSWGALVSQGAQNTADSLYIFVNGQWVDTRILFTPAQYSQGVVDVSAGGPFEFCALLTTQEGCLDTLCQPIAFLPSVDIPNVFTPNGDNINDELELTFSNTDQIYLRVYNRWGKQVYESTSMQTPWDGRALNGRTVSPGTYYLTLEASNSYTLEPRIFTASVQVIY